MIRVEDLQLGARFDIASTCRPRPVLLEDHALGALGMDAQRDVLDVQDDVGDIFPHTRNGRELMQDTVDLNGSDRSALKRRQQHATQRVAKRHAEATLQRFRDDGCDTLGIAALLNRQLLWLDQVLPVFLDNTIQKYASFIQRSTCQGGQRSQPGHVRGMDRSNPWSAKNPSLPRTTANQS